MQLMSDKQILITGCYRSGTSYVALLMGNHPRLAVAMYVVSYLRFCLGRYGDVADAANRARLLADAAERIRTRYDMALDVDRIEAEAGELDRVTDAWLYDRMMGTLFLEPGHAGWAEKVQLVWRQVPDFLDMFPNGKAVLIIRDPRNVLASFKRYTYAPEPLYLGAVFNCLDVMRWGRDFMARYPGRVEVVRFEGLLASPGERLRSLFRFLGLNADHDLTGQQGWTDAYGKPWKHNSVYAAEAGTFDKAASNDRWRTELTPEDKGLCELVCGQAMREWGYEPTGEPLPSEAEVLAPLERDEITRGYLRGWRTTGSGIQAFPTDPVDPGNWEENVSKD